MCANDNTPNGIPQYADDRQIELGCFSCMRRGGYRYWKNVYGEHPEDPKGGWRGFQTEQDFKDYLAAGFTFAIPEGDGWYDFNEVEQRETEDFRESDLYPYIEMAEKVGLPVVAGAKWLADLSVSADPELPEADRARMDKFIKDLSGYKMFRGIMLRDEPFASTLKSFGSVHRYLLSRKPDMLMYTCMLPIYGSTTCFSSNINADKVASYTEYVRTVIRETGSFIYDHYPLFIDYREPNKVTMLMEEDYYQNLEIVARAAKEFSAPAGLVVQASSWGAHGKAGQSCYPRSTFQKADISFQVYSALAYGMKSIGYYTYWEHYTQHDFSSQYSAMLMYPKKPDGTPDPEGRPIKTPAYYAVKEVNEEIKKFDHVFLRFNWEGTIAVIPEGRTPSAILSHVEPYKAIRIQEVSASQETIIGCQRDSQGYDGFMIVNVTDPACNLEDCVKIRFADARAVLCYINGEPQTIPLQAGVLEYTLQAGQGIFVIPVK